MYADVVLPSMLHVTSVAMVTFAGNLYHHGHLCRAVCCRLEHVGKLPELPQGFRLNHPQLRRVGDTKQVHPEVGKRSSTYLVYVQISERLKSRSHCAIVTLQTQHCYPSLWSQVLYKGYPSLWSQVITGGREVVPCTALWVYPHPRNGVMKYFLLMFVENNFTWNHDV